MLVVSMMRWLVWCWHVVSARLCAPVLVLKIDCSVSRTRHVVGLHTRAFAAAGCRWLCMAPWYLVDAVNTRTTVSVVSVFVRWCIRAFVLVVYYWRTIGVLVQQRIGALVYP